MQHVRESGLDCHYMDQAALPYPTLPYLRYLSEIPYVTGEEGASISFKRAVYRCAPMARWNCEECSSVPGCAEGYQTDTKVKPALYRLMMSASAERCSMQDEAKKATGNSGGFVYLK
jgi:hypothetical protein